VFEAHADCHPEYDYYRDEQITCDEQKENFYNKYKYLSPVCKCDYHNYQGKKLVIIKNLNKLGEKYFDKERGLLSRENYINKIISKLSKIFKPKKDINHNEIFTKIGEIYDYTDYWASMMYKIDAIATYWMTII
jgi:hypothetical protein